MWSMWLNVVNVVNVFGMWPMWLECGQCEPAFAEAMAGKVVNGCWKCGLNGLILE